MSSSADTDADLQEARQAMRERQYARAIEAYRRVLQQEDRHPGAHEGIATAAFMLKDYPLAVEHFKRLNMIDPRRAQPLVNLGAVYNRMGDFQSAIQSLRKALSRDSRCAEAYYNLGLAHRGLEQLPMAVSAYKEAIRLAPEMAEAYQNLANVYVEQGNTQQAVLNYERALQLRPDFERARRGLEQARAAQQQVKNAASPFGRLVDPVQQSRRVDEQSAALRLMTEQERFDDRRLVHDLAKSMEQAAGGLLTQLESDLEVRLREFARAFTQKAEARGYWLEYTRLMEATQRFEEAVDRLQQRGSELERHEDQIRHAVRRDS